MTDDQKAKAVFDVLARDRCPRGRCGNLDTDAHECPFAAEVHEDHKLCRCCQDCTTECADEI